METEYKCKCGNFFTIRSYIKPVNPICPACGKCTTMRIWECRFTIHGFSYKNSYGLKKN